MNIWTTRIAPLVPRANVPVLSVGNLKGGVGKTTVVANVAIALAQIGVRVLAIDLDFQASLSVAMPPSVVARLQTEDGGIQALVSEAYDIFHDTRITAVGTGDFANLSLVRTSHRLADAEDSLFAHFLIGDWEKDPRFALARKLSDPRLRDNFDVVIIDTPPRFTIGSINALCASTHVLIPTALTSLSSSGAVTFVEYLANFRKNLCPHIELLGVLPTFTHGELSSLERRSVENLKRELRDVDLWIDVHIPTRQDIANGRVMQNEECRSKFKALAEKIVSSMRVTRDGNDKGLRVSEGARGDRARLS